MTNGPRVCHWVTLGRVSGPPSVGTHIGPMSENHIPGTSPGIRVVVGMTGLGLSSVQVDLWFDLSPGELNCSGGWYLGRTSWTSLMYSNEGGVS